MTDSARILVVDNYDSFVYTIVGYLKTLGAAVTVVRNDAIDPGEAGVIDEYDGVLISPGPGAPADSGASEGMIRLCAEQSKPMFGVCLGMQSIGCAFGGKIVRAMRTMHGKVSKIEHDGRGCFKGIASPMSVVRYHSLAVERATLPPCLEVSAQAEDGEIMALRHREYLIEGVQFHPESILTYGGKRILANFLEEADAK